MTRDSQQRTDFHFSTCCCHWGENSNAARRRYLASSGLDTDQFNSVYDQFVRHARIASSEHGIKDYRRISSLDAFVEVVRVVAPDLVSDVHEARNLFSAFDSDGTGSVDVDELFCGVGILTPMAAASRKMEICTLLTVSSHSYISSQKILHCCLVSPCASWGALFLFFLVGTPQVLIFLIIMVMVQLVVGCSCCCFLCPVTMCSVNFVPLYMKLLRLEICEILWEMMLFFFFVEKLFFIFFFDATLISVLGCYFWSSPVIHLFVVCSAFFFLFLFLLYFFSGANIRC